MTTEFKGGFIMKNKDSKLLMAAKANMEVFISQGQEYLDDCGHKGVLTYELISGKMNKDGTFSFKVNFQTKLFNIRKKVCMPTKLYEDFGEALILKVDGKEMTWNNAVSKLECWKIDLSKHKELRTRVIDIYDMYCNKFPEITSNPSALIDIALIFVYYEDDVNEIHERLNLYIRAFYRALASVAEA